MDAPEVGGIGGTFCGNPISCAAALASFDLFENDGLLREARALGGLLQERLDLWRQKFEVVGDSRGLGPMRAIELVRSRETREPNPEGCKKLVRHAYENGVVVMSSGTYSNVLRFLMPLSIRAEELREGLDVIEAGLKDL
jgi:4-aminobutyrate aminotransferase/(S)-3-amino-2-methylpropionate transaminase